MRLVAMLSLVALLSCSTPLGARAGAQGAPAIEEAAWLAGRWVGEGFGGVVEETWAPPAGRQMVGHFRYLRAGQPQFYEIMLLDETAAGLRMRVKHFNPDFIGWEERGAWSTFEPVSVEADVLLFEGLEVRRMGVDSIIMTLYVRREGGSVQEVLRLRRAPL